MSTKDEIRKVITELCSEDDWGSWEPWWNVTAGSSSEDFTRTKKEFMEVIGEIIARRLLLAKMKTAGKLTLMPFDPRDLERQIDAASSPEPDRFYWFGTP